MQAETLDNKISSGIRRQLVLALATSTILIGCVGGMAAYAEISGAVVGAGSIIVEGRSKQVQHNEGGVVKEILVREGDSVTAGQVLFELDPTLIKANLEIVEGQLRQLVAQEARLSAEIAAKDSLSFPDDELLNGGDDDYDLSTLKEGQLALFEARRLTVEGQKQQLTEQIAQFGERIAALTSQVAAVSENTDLLGEQVADVEVLHKKGLVIDSALVTLRRERASLKGSKAALEAEIIEAKQAITERESQRLQLDKQFREIALTELDDKRAALAKLRQERVAALDRLTRLTIRSPMTGFVHQLNIHTIGRVIGTGETLMQIVPTDDHLLIEAKLRPNDIDQITKGQQARVRLTGLDRRTTPELLVYVLDVAPDLIVDPNTGASFYTARLDIPLEQRQRFDERDLKPGMPVEVFVETSRRSVLSYLVKPMRDQIEHAMRED